MLEERTETDCSTNKVRVRRVLCELHLCQGLSTHGRPCTWGVQELISHSHSIASFFNADDWEYHQTSDRYFRNLLNIGTSTVFR